MEQGKQGFANDKDDEVITLAESPDADDWDHTYVEINKCGDQIFIELYDKGVTIKFFEVEDFQYFAKVVLDACGKMGWTTVIDSVEDFRRLRDAIHVAVDRLK
jgi:hypothetical protein